jgi:hypothetical protein
MFWQHDLARCNRNSVRKNALHNVSRRDDVQMCWIRFNLFGRIQKEELTWYQSRDNMQLMDGNFHIVIRMHKLKSRL